MPVRLSLEGIVTIRVLASKGKNHCELARTVGVSEEREPVRTTSCCGRPGAPLWLARGERNGQRLYLRR